MNNLQIFKNNEFGEIRILIDEENQSWFVLRDVCNTLDIKNTSDASKRLDKDEVTRFNLGGLSGNVIMVNESGLYQVLFRSDKKEARQFTKWVTKEILPSIRKTGNYSIKNNIFNLELEKRTVMLETMTFREINDYVCKLEKQLNNFIKLKEIIKTIEIY